MAASQFRLGGHSFLQVLLKAFFAKLVHAGAEVKIFIFLIGADAARLLVKLAWCEDSFVDLGEGGDGGFGELGEVLVEALVGVDSGHAGN